MTPRAAAPVGVATAVLFLAQPALPLAVPNPSFEAGRRGPDAWTLTGARGSWAPTGDDANRRMIVAGGDGRDTSAWLSEPLAFLPNAVYRLTFRARAIEGSGGTPVSGPEFCNRDLGSLPRDWTTVDSIFRVPERLAEDEGRLRLGQWHVNGTVAFDDVAVVPARPVHRRVGSLVLGEGESIRGSDYAFAAPFNSSSRNDSRPLEGHRCGFNTNRWVFGEGGEVTYRHRVGDRRLVSGTVAVAVTYRTGGELLVEASRDGRRWKTLGTIDGVREEAFRLPSSWFPVGEVRIRLRARAALPVGPDSDPGSFQVGGYRFEATIDGEPVVAAGRTRYVAVASRAPGFEVSFLELGDGLPGGANVAKLAVTNATGAPIPAAPAIEVFREGRKVHYSAERTDLTPGTTTLALPYELTEAGRHRVIFTLSLNLPFRAETTFDVPLLHDAGYGFRLPASGAAAALWWASSGRRVSRSRPPPDARSPVMRVRAASNEAESAQFVVRPAQPLTGFTAEAGDLAGPDGASLPAGAVRVSRVGYVNVARPTDETGAAGPWPDPLPPLSGPVDLEGGANQPFWVTVTVPPGARAGRYRGTIALAAGDWRAEVPLLVEVYGFALPDRMTCVTAFGFSPWNVWRYHGLTDEADRRAVLEKYLANFGAHHVSPYDPVPLDPWRVTWPGAGGWEGGALDVDRAHRGSGSLRVVDESRSAQPSAALRDPVVIPPEGLRVEFWHRAERRGAKFIVALEHLDAGGTWMPGRNANFEISGRPAWRRFSKTLDAFPEGARAVRFRMYASPWEDDGSPTGTAWYDDLTIRDAGTGELLAEETFEPVEPGRLRPRFDWDAWDRAMEAAYSRYGFNSFQVPVPGMGGGTFHARREPVIAGYPDGTSQYREAFDAAARAIQEHLRGKGLLEDAFVYWFDEPDPKDYAFVMNGFAKLKRAAPDLTRMLTEQPEDALLGGPDLWCPVTPAYDHDRAEARRREGEKFWWYVCTYPQAPHAGLFIDHAAIEMRVWLWQTWKRGIDGILVWQTNYWTSPTAYPDPERPQNPYEDPMGWTTGYGTPPGTKIPWGNGDGRFIYPPEAAADGRPAGPVLDGPVDSIRWEMLRDGIEDYEYLATLRGLLESRRSALPPDWVERYEELLKVPDVVSRSLTDFTRDPTPLEARRHAVARAIEEILRLGSL